MEKYNKTDIALDLKPNIKNLYKYGLGLGVGVTEIELWDKPTAYYWLPVASKIQIVSSSANDVDLGSGAWQLTIQGLDENWIDQEEIINLNGITPVETVNKFIRVFRAWVSEGGSINGCEGTIDLYESGTSANQVAQIQIGKNQTHMVIYTVPANKVMLLDNADANIGQGKEATITLFVRKNITGNEVKLAKATRYIYENSFARHYKTARRIDGKTDIWMAGKTTSGTVNVSASFEARLFDKSIIE